MKMDLFFAFRKYADEYGNTNYQRHGKATRDKQVAIKQAGSNGYVQKGTDVVVVVDDGKILTV